MALALAAFLFAAGASSAGARSAYVLGMNDSSSPYVVPVDLATQTVGAQIPLPSGGEGGGGRIAITPDGTKAYAVASNEEKVVPIDIATNKAGTPIDVSFAPTAIAITPDGTKAYVTDRFQSLVTPIALATNTTLPTISVGDFPGGIAITPDGTKAYVANRGSENVSVIDIATNTVIATIPVPGEPAGASVKPDGTRIYVSEENGDTFPIDPVTNTVGAPIAGGAGGAIAVTPNSAKAYTAGTFNGNSVPLDLATGSAGTPIAVSGFPEDIAILPDGSRAYIPSFDQTTPLLVPLDLSTDQALSGFPVGPGPEAIAIVPNQGPRASFSFVPPPVATPAGGTATISSLPSVEFDAKTSSDSDGSIARYDWDFGDGASAPNGGAAPTHIYSQSGTYTVTLTVTDNEGCSLQVVFPGQTAYCNGSSVARTTRTVTVAGGSCPTVKGNASSFVPKLRSSHVVPGVRIRLAVSAPARLSVTSTLLWSKDGDRGSARLRKVNVNVDRWRRIRLALPVSLREKLPLGTPVKVKLRIAATPKDASGCTGGVAKRTLSVKVVKVIPNRAQSNPVP